MTRRYGVDSGEYLLNGRGMAAAVNREVEILLRAFTYVASFSDGD